ncbi:MAG: hypothetical protein ACC656_07825 [Candidatus Heimdallarchaeota archaeon]
MVIIVNILFFFLWIFLLAYNDLVPQSYLEDSIYKISRGILWGGIAGLIIAFFELLPKYIRKDWDLHEVVPYFLFVHLSLSIAVNIGQFFISRYDGLLKIGFGLGFVLGGLIGIIAYIGEVKLEHTQKVEDDNPKLIEGDDN